MGIIIGVPCRVNDSSVASLLKFIIERHFILRGTKVNDGTIGFKDCIKLFYGLEELISHNLSKGIVCRLTVICNYDICTRTRKLPFDTYGLNTRAMIGLSRPDIKEVLGVSLPFSSFHVL